jgi:hypothetical protein
MTIRPSVEWTAMCRIAALGPWNYGFTFFRQRHWTKPDNQKEDSALTS